MSYQATKTHRETLKAYTKWKNSIRELHSVVTTTGRSGKDETMEIGKGQSLPGVGAGRDE